jgi:hypothetical protein
MILIGHPYIEAPRFIKVTTTDEILEKSNATDMVVLENLSSSHKIAQFCQTNEIPYAIFCETITDAILGNALGANHLIASSQLAKVLQPIATEYLFDTKVLARISSESEIEALAIASVDGVIFNHHIVS